MHLLRRASSEFGASGKLKLESRALTERRFYPDAPTMHFDDLPGYGEPKTCPALDLGEGAM